MSTPSTPPGWYPDPMGRADHRHWDGKTWTEQVSRQGIVGTDPPIVTTPMTPAPVRPLMHKYGGRTLNAWFLMGIAALFAILVIAAVVNRIVNGDSSSTSTFDAGTAYEGCRQAIENRGGSAPDLPTDFGVHTDTVTADVYEFTVKDTYHCTVTKLPDGKVDVATSEVP